MEYPALVCEIPSFHGHVCCGQCFFIWAIYRQLGRHRVFLAAQPWPVSHLGPSFIAIWTPVSPAGAKYIRPTNAMCRQPRVSLSLNNAWCRHVNDMLVFVFVDRMQETAPSKPILYSCGMWCQKQFKTAREWVENTRNTKCIVDVAKTPSYFDRLCLLVSPHELKVPNILQHVSPNLVNWPSPPPKWKEKHWSWQYVVGLIFG